MLPVQHFMQYSSFAESVDRYHTLCWRRPVSGCTIFLTPFCSAFLLRRELETCMIGKKPLLEEYRLAPGPVGIAAALV